MVAVALNLNAISREIAARLKAAGCPVPVVYGPERGGVALGSQRIVFQRDTQAGDEIGPARKGRVNPLMIATRHIGSEILIFAQSTKTGATRADHEWVADQLCDQLIAKLRATVASIPTMSQVTSSKYLTAEELELRGLTAWPGVVYRIGFWFERGVFELTWMTEAGVGGEAAPETEIGGAGATIRTTTKLVGTDGSEETICEPPAP